MDTNSQKEDARSVLQLILATRNAHKTREFRELLGRDINLIDLSSLPQASMSEETGKTFAENAILKAIGISRLTDELVIADDSGLEVDALTGAPGIYSARYAGENANDSANVHKLLRELKNVANRAARFRCVIALAQNGQIIGTFEGVVHGTIVDLPRGSAGFGYDPVFQPAGFTETFAEMPPELKNRLSHRGKAVAALCEHLQKLKN
jgi:XTP/dITP diphosphohydrolase